VILPEPFQQPGHLRHFAELHGFHLSSLRGIGYLAVHRFMHRYPTGIPHTHDEGNRKRQVPFTFSPNGTPT
jgi:hypothetical protein